MKAALIFNWIIWTLLLLSWPLDMLVAYFRQGAAPEPLDAGFAGALAVTAFISLCLTFALKWLLLHFLIRRGRISTASPWAVALFITAGLLIWALAKLIEVCGFVLFLQSGSMPHYLAFWIPGLAALLLHTPYALDPRRMGGVDHKVALSSPGTVADDGNAASLYSSATGNPYAPPVSEPAAIPATAGSPVKGVVLGLLTDIGGSVTGGALLSAVYAFILAREGMSAEQIGTTIAGFAPLSGFYITAFTFGCVFSVLGGYVCERIGRRGYGSGWIMWGVATGALLLLTWFTQPSAMHVVQSIVEAAAALLFIMAGIYLARRKTRVTTAPAEG